MRCSLHVDSELDEMKASWSNRDKTVDQPSHLGGFGPYRSLNGTENRRVNGDAFSAGWDPYLTLPPERIKCTLREHR
jgi:hypothetical protein